MTILEGPSVIRPETLQHNVLWVEVVTSGEGNREPRAQAHAFAHRYSVEHDTDSPILVTSGASMSTERIEWRYGYSLKRPEPVEPQHADYPHEPGTLYDCPACENTCYCMNTADIEPCVCCVIEEESMAHSENV